MGGLLYLKSGNGHKWGFSGLRTRCSERSPNRDINQNSSGARVPAPPLRQASFLIVFVCGFFSMLVNIQSFDLFPQALLDIQEFYELTLMDESKSVHIKTSEALQMASR